MKVYIISSGEYSDTHIECVTADKKKAELFCAVYNQPYGYGEYYFNEYEVDDWDIKADRKVGYSYRFLYQYDFSHECYFLNELGVAIKFEHNSTVESKDCSSIFYPKYEISLWIEEENDEKAEKIAYDMIAEYRAKKEGLT